jgi:hypothetical protein
MSGHDNPAVWRARRYAASRRLPPLWPCGCIRDPAVDRHRCGRVGISDRWVYAGAAAAAHLLELGYTPILELEVRQALWRRGGTDRALAAQLWELAG